MAYPTYTPAMLASFTGRPVESFPEPYTSSSVIPQATLLFKMGTCLVDPSTLKPEEQQLIDFAILAMADAIHLSAPYSEALASPFSSESIGSYSYSKATSAVQQGDATGIQWFDMAVSHLGVCDTSDGIEMSGGIEIFEYQGYFVQGHVGANIQFLTPAEMDTHLSFLYGLPTPSSESQRGGEGEIWVEDPDNPGLYVPE